MEQNEVTTDEEAEQFFREYVHHPGRHADSNEKITALMTLQNNYGYKRAKGESVQTALEHALMVLNL